MWSDTVMGTGCLFWGDKNVLKLTMVKKKKKKEINYGNGYTTL